MSDNPRQYAKMIRQAIKAAARQVADNPANIHIPTPGQRGAVIGIINRVAGGDDNRKLLLGWLFAGEGELFDRVSTKVLTDEQWSALYAWCDFRKDEERVLWIPKDTFSVECLACLSAAMDDYFSVRYSERGDLPEPPELVSNIVNYGGGEITYTGVRGSGIKGVDDSMFAHEQDLPAPEIPPEPYAHASPVEKVDRMIEELGFERPAPKRQALKPIMKEKPKLKNPFD